MCADCGRADSLGTRAAFSMSRVVVVSSRSRLGAASDAGARRHYSPHAEKIMFPQSAHAQSKRTSLGLVGFFVLALALAPPVEGVIYYGALNRGVYTREAEAARRRRSRLERAR